MNHNEVDLTIQSLARGRDAVRAGTSGAGNLLGHDVAVELVAMKRRLEAILEQLQALRDA